MSDTILEGFLIKIIFVEANPREEINFIRSLSRKTEHIKSIDKNHIIADNSAVSLYIISKLIDKYHPLIWVYELKEFAEFKIPRVIKDFAQANKEFYSKFIEKQLEEISIEELGVNDEKGN